MKKIRQITKQKRAKSQSENTPNHKTKLRQITKFDIIYLNNVEVQCE